MLPDVVIIVRTTKCEQVSYHLKLFKHRYHQEKFTRWSNNQIIILMRKWGTKKKEKEKKKKEKREGIIENLHRREELPPLGWLPLQRG